MTEVIKALAGRFALVVGAVCVGAFFGKAERNGRGCR